MKNLTRKLLVALLAVFMVFANATTVKAENGKLTVEGAENGDTVTFYQIAEITYDEENGDVKPMNQWNYAFTTDKQEGANTLKRFVEPVGSNGVYTTAEIETLINTWANGLQAKPATMTALKSYDVVVANGKAEKADAPAGVYVAIVTDKHDPAEGEHNKIYNPVLLSLVYNNGQLEPAAVNFNKKYNENGTAKSSTPGGDKEIVSGTTQDGTLEDDLYDEDAGWEEGPKSELGAKTASKDEVVGYRVKLDVPSYPQGAVNKTMWAKDTLPTGVHMLTELGEDTTLAIDGQKVAAATAEDVAANEVDEKKLFDLAKGDLIVKNAAGKIIAKVQLNEADDEDADVKGGGWQMVFNYEHLTAGSSLIVTYSAKVTDKAEIGRTGNKNELCYKYSNNPNQGGTHDDESEEPTEGCDEWYDEEIIYTYEVAVVKVDNKDNTKVLEGAEFDVYYSPTSLGELTADNNPEKKGLTKVGEAVSGPDGIASLSHVKVGYYYFVETKAPEGGYSFVKDGYSNVTEVVANWESAVYKRVNSGSISWTTDATKALDPANPKEDGYLDKAGKHITDAEYAALSDEKKAEYQRAYVKSKTSLTKVTDNLAQPKDEEGKEPVGINRVVVTNSKEPSLPSTGGIGTYIFTIAGVAILATAAFMLIFRKKEEA